MLSLKNCPKCSGDMYFQSDMYGPYWQCLQCGLLRDVAPATMQQHLLVSDKVATRRVAG